MELPIEVSESSTTTNQILSQVKRFDETLRESLVNYDSTVERV